MKFLGSTKIEIISDANGEDVPHLEIIEVVLVHCNIAHNCYQYDSRVLYTFFPTDISPKNFIFLKSFNLEF